MERKINWKYEIGDIIKNEYRDVTILDKEIRVVEYNDKNGHPHILNKKYYKYQCNICSYIGWVREGSFNDEKRDFHVCKKFDNFYYNINDNIKDEKRDLKIINRKYEHFKGNQYHKYYQYHCNKCGWNDGWAREVNLKKGNGCACCSGKILVKGINDIATTNPEVLKYLVDKNDGYLYTKGDKVKIKCKCPECGNIEYKNLIDLIRYGFVCHRCGDGISYPEKFIYSMFNQLNVYFDTQLSKRTFKWCDKYYYDIYFVHNDELYIVEIHGMQHYENKYNFYGKVNTHLEQQKIDKIKKELAIKNGIKENNYIILDCRYSNNEYIINSVFKSKLSNIFNLNNVDFNKCNEYAMSSKMIRVCKYYEQHPNIKIIELADIFKCSRATIRSYLFNGDYSGIIKYNWEEHKNKQVAETGKHNGKNVGIFDLDNKLLGEFISCAELERQSLKLFGIELKAAQIGRSCRGELKGNYKGFIFKYI